MRFASVQRTGAGQRNDLRLTIRGESADDRRLLKEHGEAAAATFELCKVVSRSETGDRIILVFKGYFAVHPEAAGSSLEDVAAELLKEFVAVCK